MAADSGKTTRGLWCATCRGPCRIPAWITNAGGPNYQNNDAKQHLAIVRAHNPVTTEYEREQAKRNTAARAAETAHLVPTRRGYGVTIPNEAEWVAANCSTQTGAIDVNAGRKQQQRHGGRTAKA